MVKLKALEVNMEEGVWLRQKLVEIVANCEKMKHLPPESKAIVFTRKNLRQAIDDTKQEVEKAEEFVNGIGIIISAVDEKEKLEKDEVFFNLHRFIYLYFVINKIYFAWCFF